MKRETLFVTGASSFLGNALIPILIKRYSARLVLICRKQGACSEWKKNERISIEEADLTEKEKWEPLFNKYRPDSVVHLAAIARFADGEKEPETAFNTNFWGTVEIIRLCKKYRVQTFLFTSSDLARNAISTVGISKYLIERLIIANNSSTLRMMGVRIANLIDGTGSVTLLFKKQIAEGKDLTITHPDMSRRFSKREEAANDLVWLLENGENQTIYVVNKPPLKIVDLAQQMIEKAGKGVTIRFIGAKPGEKLAEPSYDEFVIHPVNHPYLARLDAVNYADDELLQVVDRLKTGRQTKEIVKDMFSVAPNRAF